MVWYGIVEFNENRQRLYNLPRISLKETTTRKRYALCYFTKFVPTLSKQSTAEYGRRLCLFCPSNKLTFFLLTLKVVSE